MTRDRVLDLSAILAKKSHFLLGPRGTGKSTLVREQLIKPRHAALIDLLDKSIFRTLLNAPEQLEEIASASMARANRKWVVIDEVQKIPELLDEVHRLIEAKRWTFLLTGS